MAARSYFKVILPLKPYTFKYISKNYGSPFYINFNDVLGYFIALALEKTVYPNLRTVDTHNAVTKLNAKIEIYLPRLWLTKYYYGTTFPDKKILFLNDAIEKMFQSELYQYVQHNREKYVTKEEAIISFCNHYNIIIDEDVTMDALLKMEYRFRIKKQNPPNLSFPKKTIQTALFS